MIVGFPWFHKVYTFVAGIAGLLVQTIYRMDQRTLQLPNGEK